MSLYRNFHVHARRVDLHSFLWQRTNAPSAPMQQPRRADSLSRRLDNSFDVGAAWVAIFPLAGTHLSLWETVVLCNTWPRVLLAGHVCTERHTAKSMKMEVKAHLVLVPHPAISLRNLGPHSHMEFWNSHPMLSIGLTRTLSLWRPWEESYSPGSSAHTGIFLISWYETPKSRYFCYLDNASYRSGNQYLPRSHGIASKCLPTVGRLDCQHHSRLKLTRRKPALQRKPV